MTPELAQYIQDGYELTPEERLEAARMLRLSVDRDVETEQSVIDAAWETEIQRRVDDVQSGRAELVDGEESFRRVRAHLDSLRD